ncbi:MAG TPA: response regulator transcription factor [Chloroflexota bacterium]|nr:response regulator transcription factor [Chloroflexota bacterium]
MRILLVDDDSDLLDVTGYALRREGFDVIVAANGAQALRRWQADKPDLIVLDISMPHLSGLEVCRRIRELSTIPIVMLTGASDEPHIIDAFQQGADDYVTKPFSPKVLAVRIRAVLKRGARIPEEEPSQQLQVGDSLLDIEACQIRKGEQIIQLTALEFRILHALALNEGKVVSFRRLIECAWGFEEGDTSTLKTHISHIRKKMDRPPGQPGYIGVVQGIGYYLTRASQSSLETAAGLSKVIALGTG